MVFGAIECPPPIFFVSGIGNMLNYVRLSSCIPLALSLLSTRQGTVEQIRDGKLSSLYGRTTMILSSEKPKLNFTESKYLEIECTPRLSTTLLFEPKAPVYLLLANSRPLFPAQFLDPVFYEPPSWRTRVQAKVLSVLHYSKAVWNQDNP